MRTGVTESLEVSISTPRASSAVLRRFQIITATMPLIRYRRGDLEVLSWCSILNKGVPSILLVCAK